MTLESIMTRQVVTVSMDSTLREIRHTFLQHGFRHLLVVDHQRVVGVISDRDLLRNLSPFVDTPAERALDAASLNRRAHQIMTRRLVAGTAAMPVATGAAVMLRHRISCLPVMDARGRCVGIVTLADLLRAAFPQEGAAPATPAPQPDRRLAA